MFQRQAKFSEREDWYRAIADAVERGLTFTAWDWGMANDHAFVIEYTGGY